MLPSSFVIRGQARAAISGRSIALAAAASLAVLLPCRNVVAQLPARAAAPASTASSRWDDAIARGRETLRALVDSGRAPGVAVAVAVQGEIVWSEGFGFADIERRVPATAHTRFGLGSISKSLTMAAAMSLADDGLLDIDAPVERYLPDFPHRGRGITVRRLAAHQSGLADDFATAHYSTTVHFPSLDSAYRHIRGERIAYEPGSDTVYATGLYTIIGRVLEAADGAPFADVVRRRVLAPAGATGIVPNDPRSPPADRARYFVEARSGGFAPAPAVDPSFKLPGAGYVASAGDIARVGAALLRPGLLSDSAREELFAPVSLADGRPTRFALGFRVGRDGDRRMIHQPGGGLGISSWIFLFPEEQLVVALLSNVATGPVGGATRRAITSAFLEAMDRP